MKVINRREFLAGAGQSAVLLHARAHRLLDQGGKVDGTAVGHTQLYTFQSADLTELSWDLCTPCLHIMLRADGQPRCAVIGDTVRWLPPSEQKGGVYSDKRLRYAAPDHWCVLVDGVPLTIATPQVVLLGNVAPRFRWRVKGFTLTVTYWVVEKEAGGDELRAKVVLRSHSATPADVECQLRHSVLEPAFAGVDRAASSARISNAKTTCRLQPGQAFCWNPVWTVPPEGAGLTDDRHRNGSRLDDFLASRAAPYQGLDICGDPAATASYARMGELARQSLLANDDGHVVGGFLGSDFDQRASNWTRDSYYAALSTSVTQPSLCARVIPFLLEWGMPRQCTGRGLSRFPGAGPVTQSLSNSVAGVCLAGAYLRATGDLAWFQANPGIQEKVRSILDAVVASRRQTQYTLFPSMYVSDGDARGDFHTGSNVAAWFAFVSAARIARHAYGDADIAEQWERLAESLHADIARVCTNASLLSFVEGANGDGSRIPGHDGEESDTTLMPFYGFCSTDDPRLLTHASSALSPANPYYAPSVDGIWWYNEHWGSATFPGWTTHLAGAANEADARKRMARIHSLMDLDGSIWWWPYPYGTTEATHPRRANGARKCAWAASIYLLTFVTKLVGLQVDAFAKTVVFAPLSPWPRWRLNKFQYGSTVWSGYYEQSPHGMELVLSNENREGYSAEVLLASPPGLTLSHMVVDEGAAIDRSGTYYGRAAIRIKKQLQPFESLRFRAALHS